MNTRKKISLVILLAAFIILPLTGVYQSLVHQLVYYTQISNSMIAFLVVYTVCSLFVSPWPWLALLAGSLYGTFNGIWLSLCASIIGNMASFMLGHLYFERLAQFFCKGRPDLKPYHVKNLNLFELCIIQTSPILPQRPLNFILGGVGVNIKRFFTSIIIGSSIFNIPAVIIGKTVASPQNLHSLKDINIGQLNSTSLFCYLLVIASLLYTSFYTIKICKDHLQPLLKTLKKSETDTHKGTVILLLDDKSGAALLRLLGKANYEIIVVTYSRIFHTVFKRSKYTKKSIFIDKTKENAKNISALLRQEIKKNNVQHVFSSGYSLYAFKETLGENLNVNFFSCQPEDFFTLNNKLRFIKCLKKLNIQHPKTKTLTNHFDFSNFGAKKAIVKPVTSCSGAHLHLIESQADIDRLVQNIAKDHTLNEKSYIVQEFIEGTLVHTSALINRGKIIGLCSYKPIEAYGRFGVSLIRETIHSSYAQSLVEKIVRHFNYSGAIGFDIIQTESGEYYPIECNPRATPGLFCLQNKSNLVAACLSSNPQDEAAYTVKSGIKFCDAIQFTSLLLREFFAKRNFNSYKKPPSLKNAQDDFFVKGDRRLFFSYLFKVIITTASWPFKMNKVGSFEEYVRQEGEVDSLCLWLFRYTGQFDKLESDNKDQYEQ